MKKFLILFATLFCTVAFADTMSINWGVDNQTYTTTTCEIGNDVLLPTNPTKRGYTFKGWKEEHIFRGNYSDFSSVPDNSIDYPLDVYNNKVPANRDYIIITDASDYLSVSDFNDSFEFYNVSQADAWQTIWAWKYNGIEHRIRIIDFDGWTALFGPNNEIRITRHASSSNVSVYAEKTLLFNNRVFFPGQKILSTTINDTRNATNPYIAGISSGTGSLNGMWRFVYSGVWSQDNKYGWKPDYEISNVTEE